MDDRVVHNLKCTLAICMRQMSETTESTETRPKMTSSSEHSAPSINDL